MSKYIFRDATISSSWRQQDHQSLLRLALQAFRDHIKYLAIDPEAADPSGDGPAVDPSLMAHVNNRHGVTEAAIDPSDERGVDLFVLWSGRSALATVWRDGRGGELCEFADGGRGGYHLTPGEHGQLVAACRARGVAMPSGWGS